MIPDFQSVFGAAERAVDPESVKRELRLAERQSSGAGGSGSYDVLTASVARVRTGVSWALENHTSTAEVATTSPVWGWQLRTGYLYNLDVETFMARHTSGSETG